MPERTNQESPVSMEDVARLAGVSSSTVSRVLSGSQRISEPTTKKVLQAVSQLGFHPNTAARNLAAGKTKTIGLLLPASASTLADNGFFIRAMVGVARFAQENEYSVMFAFAKDKDEEYKLTQKYVKSKVTDGVLLFFSRQNDPCVEYLKKIGFPFCVIGRPAFAEGCSWVDNDNFQASAELTRYLLSNGHRSISYFCGPSDYYVTIDRLNGFRSVMEAEGCPLRDDMILENGEFTCESGYAFMVKLLERRDSIHFSTAIMACDDMMAIGALNALRDAGIRGISVVGFNNIATSAMTDPALTTVDVNADKLGENAAKLLIEQLGSAEEIFRHNIVKSTLICRKSVFAIPQ